MRHDRLKRLSHEDRLEIQDLIVSYAALLDLQRFDELTGLFIACGVIELPDGRLQGVPEFISHLQSTPARRLHHVDSIWLSCCAWDCQARSHYFETGWDAARSETVVLTAGIFEDLIVHVDDQWRFGRRRFDPLDPSTSLPAALPALTR